LVVNATILGRLRGVAPTPVYAHFVGVGATPLREWVLDDFPINGANPTGLISKVVTAKVNIGIKTALYPTILPWYLQKIVG
jgi:hypothetical protein